MSILVTVKSILTFCLRSPEGFCISKDIDAILWPPLHNLFQTTRETLAFKILSSWRSFPFFKHDEIWTSTQTDFDMRISGKRGKNRWNATPVCGGKSFGPVIRSSNVKWSFPFESFSFGQPLIIENKRWVRSCDELRQDGVDPRLPAKSWNLPGPQMFCFFTQCATFPSQILFS